MTAARRGAVDLEAAFANLGYRGMTYIEKTADKPGYGSRNFVTFSHDDVRIVGRESLYPHGWNDELSKVAAPGTAPTLSRNAPALTQVAA